MLPFFTHRAKTVTWVTGIGYCDNQCRFCLSRVGIGENMKRAAVGRPFHISRYTSARRRVRSAPSPKTIIMTKRIIRRSWSMWKASIRVGRGFFIWMTWSRDKGWEGLGNKGCWVCFDLMSHQN